MNEYTYIKRLFQAYYQEKQFEIPKVSSFNLREFGLIPWEKKVYMKRHMSFDDLGSLRSYLITNAPRHLYSSGSLYLKPEVPDMNKKEYQGCDFIIDIDVDHFYTPCKDEHDLWICKECGNEGTGMPQTCPNCKGSKFSKVSWVCDQCLDVAKNEINKLVFNFLIPDFGIDEKHLKIAFSGHRGYHLKIEGEDLRKLNSEERREIVDYVSGKNVNFEILGLNERFNGIYGLLEENIGWSQKIMKKIIEVLNKPTNQIETLLLDKNHFDFNTSVVTSFLKYKNDFLEVITKGERNIWSIEGFGLTNWKKLLRGIVALIGIELDEPVSIDIHRLIRYPGSLHGKTGFKVQEIELNELNDFNPLDEPNEKLDPIVFKSKQHTTYKLEIIENKLPITTIKGESFGPYIKGDIIDVPHHFAVFLLCKEVAKTI